MKIRIERDVLAESVSWAARALPNRPSIPTLAGLLLDATDQKVTIAGYDLENGSQVAASADVDEPGRVLVSGRLLADISRSLSPAPVTIATDGTRVELRCGRSSFVLPTLPVDEYPALPLMPNPVGSLSGQNFASAVSQVAVAAGRDDTLPMLLGVRIEIDDSSVTLAATDRYRLAVREFTWRPDQPGFSGAALVPAKVLSETAKLLAAAEEVSVAYAPGDAGEGLMGFEGDGRRTTTRLLDGDFPKYRQLLPEESTTVSTVDRETLIEAVKRVSLVAERNTPVRLTFSEGEVVLAAGSGEDAQATEVLEGSTDGDAIDIAFNPNYLLDGLGAVTGNTVRVSFTGSTRPAVLTPENDLPRDRYRYLLMPVRMNS